MTASKNSLNALHALLAETFAKLLSEQVDAEGNPIPVPPATLNVIRQFLKDNGIEALDVPDSPMRKLVSSLPFPSHADDADIH